MIDWGDARIRSIVDKVLFSSEDLIQANDTLHQEFWGFFEKVEPRLRDFQSGRADGSAKRSSSSQSSRLELPSQYDQNLRIGSVVHPKEEWKRIVRTQPLTEADWHLCTTILNMFYDYIEKRNFGKVMKMLNSQKTLPIAAFRAEIIQSLMEHQTIIIAGDTGCGKSTQVPQYLLKAGYNKIVCTQPRRISAISLSRRVGQETLNEFGSKVGYKIRFDSHVTAATGIMFVTEGVLLRNISSDPLLSQFDVVIIDEVHERHLTTDFLLGLLRALLTIRKDLKLILMSATINTGLFSDYFAAPVISVPGRLHPITVEYLPTPQQLSTIKAEEDNKSRRTLLHPPLPHSGSRAPLIDPAPFINLLGRIDQQYSCEERGDLLVFLSGMQEIQTVAEAAREYARKSKKWIVLMLHSSLSSEDQDKVFEIAPPGYRKCILSTNIAETAVTIDGIRFVCDSGKVKEMKYNPEMRSHCLTETWTSVASADQRKGRAGRTGPGICFRLYPCALIQKFEPFSPPEIHRVSLDAVVLQIKAMGLGDPRKFPFIEPPSQSAVSEAVQHLKQLGSLSPSSPEQLLPLGAILSTLPVDVNLGKMLALVSIFELEDELLTLAAVLSIQSPMTYTEAGSSIAQQRSNLFTAEGDAFTLLKVFDEWIRMKAEKGEGSKKWCQRHGVEEQRLYQVQKLKDQFASILSQCSLLNQTQRPSFLPKSVENNAKRKVVQALTRDRERSNRRKVLSPEHADGEGHLSSRTDDIDDGIGYGSVDLKAMEFELRYELPVLLARSNRDWSAADINILKFVICASLYPHYALPDPRNGDVSPTEATFHTLCLNNVFLHPTCVFAAEPNAIHSDEMLMYSTLLSTHKPFLTNVTRAPLISLFLVAVTIDVSSDCSMFLVDNWLMIKTSSAHGEQILCKAVTIRNKMDRMFTSRLDTAAKKILGNEVLTPEACAAGDSHSGTMQPQMPGDLTATLLLCEKQNAEGHEDSGMSSLGEDIAEFFALTVALDVSRINRREMMWRLLHPMLKKANPSADELMQIAQVIDANMELQPTNGADAIRAQRAGIPIRHWLYFGSLYPGDVSLSGFNEQLQRPWVCPKCHRHMIVNLSQRIHHQVILSL